MQNRAQTWYETYQAAFEPITVAFVNLRNADFKAKPQKLLKPQLICEQRT